MRPDANGIGQQGVYKNELTYYSAGTRRFIFRNVWELTKDFTTSYNTPRSRSKQIK